MSQHSTNGSTNRAGSLTSAVSSLVRAQYGLASRAEAGESSTDLDKHVADLLLAEAKEREARAKASQSYTSWSFSDDEDGSGKQYTSKTNKRFLKNMLKGVEEHNAPLRRKENSPSISKAKESLDEIRRREREARERRLGITDAQRTGSSTETNAKNGDRKAGPGFAARMLATGLSGAVAAREDRARKDKDVEKAVEDARGRAEKDRREASAQAVSSRKEQKTADYKGKGRERDDSSDVHRKETLERRRSRSKERSKDRQGISRRRAKRDYASDSCGEEDRRQRRRDRSRSRSPGQREGDSRKSRSDRSDRRHRYEREREQDDRELRDSRRRRETTRSPDREHKYTRERTSRRSVSADRRSLSEEDSDASSDTFIDYTGATDAAEAAGGGSKMDKYFSSNYNPALDISVADLEDPKTGLIAEGNFSEWDKMLHTLQKRKEDKAFGVTRAREEERERQLRKLERRRRREERELRHALKKDKKKRKKRRHSESDESDSEASMGPKESFSTRDRKRSKEPGTVVIDGFEYGKKGSMRAWDMGKESTPL